MYIELFIKQPFEINGVWSLILIKHFMGFEDIFENKQLRHKNYKEQKRADYYFSAINHKTL